MVYSNHSMIRQGLTKAPDGFLIGNRSEKFKRTMEIAEKFMKKYHNTLRELAK